MTAASAAASQTKRLMKLTLSLFRRGFESGKCKTAAKMTVARIKLLRNKRQAVVKQMRRDIALLLQSGQDATARVRVEHVIREQNILAANEFIELFCELIVARLQIIAKQKACPADLKEGISSLIFAAPRCSEIPELATIREVFGKKYGKDFVSAAVDLRPNSGVNRMLIEKLSVKTPSGETKLKVMKEIAKEYQIEWDTTESEMELLKPPEEKIEGPKTFVSASSLPVNPAGGHSANSIKQATRVTDSQETENTLFQDAASAAEVAAESAKKAVAAAQAAAYLANRGSGNDPNTNSLEAERFYRRHSYNVPPAHSNTKVDESESFEGSDYKGSDDLLSHLNDPKMYRRHSYNAPSVHSDVKFDESDFEDEIEMDRLPPPVPSSQTKRDPVPLVHPKLPDYDDLAARFEALKYRK
ncbi:IST1-like protein isoform X2 [Punica granatum]|uniref:Uncharacterized protein n=2 Tax=Punica granatum TaxID=22663 RepID=A0A218W839_PUNGR|nr:IST1-like protein isoform X2 [Punica granatum]OWM68262.1 hypothetical protein CDL15_Pgr004744 [Punica granatum]PKI56005.1 hypothetical protein CRG98_023592 [Punica granatum]